MSRLFKRKPLTRLLPLAAVALLAPSIALAGGKAVMVTSAQPMDMGGDPSTSMTLTWRDANTMRMDFGDPNNYLIMLDGKGYSVSEDEGETMVMDMSGMGDMIRAMAGKEAKTDQPFGSINSVTAANSSKTVAGIKGQVYNITWTEPDGSQQSGEAVLTNDPLVVEMTNAYMTSMGAMVGADFTRTFKAALPSSHQGLLQVGEQFHVESVQSADPSASLFTLPAEPMDLKGLLGELSELTR